MESLLDTAREFFAAWVKPRANAMDSDPVLLLEAMRHMERLGLLCLRRPEEFGGPELPEAEFREFQELAARHSGALAFLQTQHQSAVSLIAKSENEALKSDVLTGMHRLSGGVGLGFSQLRRGGPPIMRAEECGDGWILEGHVPWVTGWSIFPRYLIAAAMPDGRAVFGLMPLDNAEQETGGAHRISRPMGLAAMEGAQTVTADIAGWRLPESQLVAMKPPGWIEANDMINVTLQGWFALGCARAGLDIVEDAYVKRRAGFLRESLEALEHERLACREAMGQTKAPLEQRLEVRAWGIDLAGRCAQAAVAASGGQANSVQHAAQRVYREALVFSVSAQTPAIMEATLRRLVARGGRE